MTRPVNRLCLSVWTVVAAALATGCAPTGDSSREKTEAKSIPVRAVAVAQTEIKRTSTQPATVHPFYRAEIRANVSGYVKELQADIGDVVAAGDLLAQIDVPELVKQRSSLESQIARREAEERRAAAGVELARANVQSAEAKLGQARSGLDEVAATLAAAEAEFSRTADLVARQSLQSRVLDEARQKRDAELARRNSAESAIAAAEADVIVAKAMASTADSERDVAAAETAIARRQLEELDVLIDYAAIKAPFEGVVTERTINPGDLVRVASDAAQGVPLFVVSRADKVRVQIPVPEADAAWVNRGDAVSLSFPFFPSETPLEGTVARLAGSLDPSTRTMLVEAEMENQEGKLIPGMFGQATITLSTRVAVNTLPARAIRYDESGEAYVYVISDEEVVSKSVVRTGVDDGRSIEIIYGVAAGQRVVDANLHRFVEGQRVTLLSE